MTYSYDGASQLTGINYALGGTALWNLTYAYDLAGRRTAVGGSFARTGLPNALTSASYNANNQMTQFGAASLTYDLNGNLTGDGTNTYTWNARNQLARISGGVAASFQYDAFGRRVGKTVGSTTEYLYDGVNPVQELASGVEAANLLTGLGVDEYFQRTDASGSANFLTDALGSTLALTDSGGNTLASYSYEPFGNTSVTGSSANPFQYTSRENDSTGLEFYRSRYYSPIIQRFISEDPIGFLGGANLCGYVLDSPTNLVDPTGGNPTVVVGTAAGAAVSVTTTVTVTSIGGGSAPVFALVAEGSGGGSWAGPIGALAGIDAALLVNDISAGAQLYNTYYDSYFPPAPSRPSPNSDPSGSSSARPGANPLAGRGQCKNNDDDCDLQRENDESVCRALPDRRARARCWRSAAERFVNCKRHVYVPPLVTDPNE